MKTTLILSQVCRLNVVLLRTRDLVCFELFPFTKSLTSRELRKRFAELVRACAFAADSLERSAQSVQWSTDSNRLLPRETVSHHQT